MIGSLVTGGYSNGSFIGSIAELVTMGYGIGDIPPPPDITINPKNIIMVQRQDNSISVQRQSNTIAVKRKSNTIIVR